MKPTLSIKCKHIIFSLSIVIARFLFFLLDQIQQIKATMSGNQGNLYQTRANPNPPPNTDGQGNQVSTPNNNTATNINLANIPPPSLPPHIFALTPELAIRGVVDMFSSDGRKL